MKKTICILLLLFLLAGCCKKEDVSRCVISTQQYGFWGGLWHGFIILPDFIGSLIWDDVTIYSPNNNGGWYAFGFCIGCGAIFGSASKATDK